MRCRSLVAFSTVGLALARGGTANAAPSDTQKGATSLASTSDPEAPDESPARYVAPRDPSRFQLGLGTGLMLGLGEVTEQQYDVIGSNGGPIFLDVTIAPAYRVTDYLALGMRAGVGLEPGSRGAVSSSGRYVSIDRRLWHASATGRYQPLPGRGVYLSGSVGVAWVVDSRGSESLSQWAPMLGAAAGYDVHLSPLFSLGLELRTAFADFGKVGSEASSLGRLDYQGGFWLGAGVVINVRP